jgi:hypothetical protein
VIVTTTTDNPTGYYTTINTNSSTDNCLKPTTELSTPCTSLASNHKINPNTGTLVLNPDGSVNPTSLSTLTNNQWGATLSTNFTNPDKGNDSVWFGIPNDTSPVNIKTSTNPTYTGITPTGEDTTVTFGTKVDYSLPAGSYQTTVVFTALTNTYNPPAPTIASVTPNNGALTGGTAITVAGTNLNTAYQVFIDLNGNGNQDTGEACTSANITNPASSTTTITCETPTGTAGTYRTIVKTWGGVTPNTVNDDYTYQPPAPTATWVKAANNNTVAITSITGASATQFTVDLDANMIPVVNQAIDNSYPANWCNYDDKQWCNAVTVNPSYLATAQAAPAGTPIPEEQILGYFTYIPRYAYEVQRPNAIDKFVTAQNFDIKFEKSTTAKKTPATTCSSSSGSEGNTGTPSNAKDYRTECSISRTYGAATGTTWATHPAFTLGSTELNGLWVGKFETGTDTYCYNNTATTPASCGQNVAPNNIYIKPNKAPMTYKYIGAMFRIANNMGTTQTTGGNTITNNTATNTMNLSTYTSTQMKNDQWGAVAYLSQSIYGTTATNPKVYNNGYRNGNVSSNSTCTVADSTATSATGCRFLTGAGPVASQSDSSGTTLNQYHTTIGQQASTTGNVYGIYDLSGGAWEYVMGNRNATSSTTYIATMPNANYFNNYPVPSFGTQPSWSSSLDENYYNNDVCTWATCGGHALHETKTVQSVSLYTQSWGSDYSYFVHSGASWFQRGGVSNDGSTAGVFASDYYQGNAYNYIGFRVVLGVF